MTHIRRIVGRTLLAGLLLFIGAVPGVHASDGQRLAQVKARGVLRCGVSEGITGFSSHDAAGLWAGIDVDFCRAVAAAALGSPDRVAFVPLRASERFPALEDGVIDVLARNTSWTLLRESTLGVQFAGVLFYDSQAFMVRTQGAPQTLAGLRDAAVCVEKGTSSQAHLLAYSAANRLNLRPLVFASAAEAGAAFFSGRCSAWTSDASQLAAARLHAPGGPQTWVILPERISQEPLGPAVRGDDLSWLVLVRWVLFGLLAAEELGVTRANLAQRSHEAVVLQALVAGDEVDRSLGVESGWMLRAVQAVGNYGELFDRNLGPHSPFDLERGLNRLWTQGGLMYAPPVR
ncbi:MULTISPECIES: amino acid ABC transporter substrate-binding protein [Paraburkholderia]|uniref:Amino acid ABC transporter substrate-binding protein n=1 Tax=Paraburkholderia podalyriae TaxID=1938811 RepID=A0ABR7PXW6_9BURK|nr:amino acid ABC transporter substrate-binding protein [Paraburkholderia podalyriae]MBC8751136.1 amino acid ABC transporter substrate-binding protein [Paraburkholderia podalyriae]